MGAMRRQELDSSTAQVFALLLLLWVCIRVQFVLGFEEWAYYVQHHVQHPKKNTISIKMGMLMSKFVLKNLFLIQSLIITFMSKFVFPAQSLSNLLGPARDSSFLSNKVSKHKGQP